MSSESLEFASAELDQVYTEKCLMAGEEQPTGDSASKSSIRRFVITEKAPTIGPSPG